MNTPPTLLLKADDSFVLYRLPGEKDYHLVLQHPGAESDPTDWIRKKGFVFHPFLVDRNHPVLFIRADQFIVNPKICFSPRSEPVETGTTLPEYHDMASSFLKALNGQQYRKLVLSRRKVIPRKDHDLPLLFNTLHIAYPDAFVYLLNHPVCGTWAGASPEVFLQEKDGLMESYSLAGTRLVDSGNPGRPWPDKDIKEQQVVTDYVQGILDRQAIRYQKEGPDAFPAGAIEHLRTLFRFSCPDRQIARLIDEMHPTPAVCGWPKEEARDFILQTEYHNRAYYTGFAGPVGLGSRLALFVNLRCMKITAEQFILYLGGGILRESIPENEWQETEAKAGTMEKVLNHP